MLQKFRIILLLTFGCLFLLDAQVQDPVQPQADLPETTNPGELPAQPTATNPGTAGQQPKTTPLPVEYTLGEFPEWALQLRRGEIIFIGALPITFFLVIEFYDIYRYFNAKIETGNWNPNLAPWPLSSPDKKYEETEPGNIILAALSLALVISVTDYLIGGIRGRQLRSAE